MNARIVEVRLTGSRKKDAGIQFAPGPNVLTGDSDTGKSYLLNLIDFALGAEELTKRIEEAADYETVWLELTNDNDETLSLKRQLDGGDIKAYKVPIDDARHSPSSDVNRSDSLVSKRSGQSTAPDVTSRLFPFFGMSAEVRVRKNQDGVTQRLSIRTLLPTVMVTEGSIIDESSPLLRRVQGGKTASKRMFNYLLTGSDDSEVVARDSEKSRTAEISAKLALIDELLEPVEKRLAARVETKDDSSLANVESNIEALSDALSENKEVRALLREQRKGVNQERLKADTQLLGIDGLLTRYTLLNEQYRSDLERLDFLSEGVHFYGSLQVSVCALCGKPFDGALHDHSLGSDVSLDTEGVQASTRAEAAKIRGLQIELQSAIADLTTRLQQWQDRKAQTVAELAKLDQKLDIVLEPAKARTKSTLAELVARRLDLQYAESNRTELARLTAVKVALEHSLPDAVARTKWPPIDSQAVQTLCREIEKVLIEWSWEAEVRVQFDERSFDISVNGKPRRSHGKGFRAVLHAAFTIGLLRYSQAKGTPHPGFVVLDSPLTTFKQGSGQEPSKIDIVEGEIVERIEPNFWQSLAGLDSRVQVIVVDNKEPPVSLRDALHAQLFAGREASSSERAGFL